MFCLIFRICLFLDKTFPNLDFEIKIVEIHPGDFRSWESPQPLPALFIGPFERVERFRNLKFAVIRISGIQSAVLSSSEGTDAFHLAFKVQMKCFF